MMSTGSGGASDAVWLLVVASGLMLSALPIHGVMWMLRRRAGSRYVRVKAAIIAVVGWAAVYVLAFGIAIVGYCESCDNAPRDFIWGLVLFVVLSAAHYGLYRTWKDR